MRFGLASLLLVTVLPLGACAPTAPGSSATQSASSPAAIAPGASDAPAHGAAAKTPAGKGEAANVATGVVRNHEPDPARSGKQFIGADLERDDGTRWVLGYGRDPLWQAFDGRRVEVHGEHFEPQNQALLAPHFRVHTLRVIDERAGALQGFGAEQAMEGTIQRFAAPPNSKAAGFGLLELVEKNGKRWLLEYAPDDAPRGRPVTVRARPVEPSPTWAARVGGDYLWITEAKAR